MSATVTTDQIAEALSVHRTSVVRRASSEFWLHQTIAGRGGQQRRFFVGALPEAVRARVTAMLAAEEMAQVRDVNSPSLRQMIESKIADGARLSRDIRVALCERELAAESPALPAKLCATPLATGIGDDQRRTAEARMALLAEIDRLASSSSVKTAIAMLAEMAESGRLSERLMALVPIANARSGGGRSLSTRTLKRWRAMRRSGGFAALAPQERVRETQAPWWAEGLLRHYRLPGKPKIAEALREYEEELKPFGLEAPSYQQARSFIRSLGTVELSRGRMGPRALKTLKPYVKRDDSDLNPLDVVLIDGHQYDAEETHPFHGGPFRPEITTVIDAKTRLALGLSLGLAESAAAVMDAVRDAVLRWGIPAILYTDRGSGNLAQAMSGPAVGLLARLGVTHTTSLPYNSQARGRSERAHATLWVASARQRATYIGRDMDAEAKTRAHKLTRRDPEGRGRALMRPWREFVEDCQARVDAYNHRPHRSLPKTIDPVTGKRRHQSPIESWRAAIEGGWSPETVPAEIADDLFRPHAPATTRRGLVSLSNLQYFHESLVEYGGQRVQVAYEPTDPAFVWVKTMEGRLICKAALDAHKRGYMPMSMVEQARETRRDGRIRLHQGHMSRIEAERLGPAIEHVTHSLTIEQEANAEAVIEQLRPTPALTLAPIEAGRRPASFGSDERKLEWMARNPDLIDADDLQWFAETRAQLGERVFSLIYGDIGEQILAQRDAPEKRSAVG